MTLVRLAIDKLAIVFLFALLFVGISQLKAEASSFSGRVVLVRAGDTLDVLDNNEVVTIKLYGILVPGPNEPYARQARETVADLAAGTLVRVVPMGQRIQNQVAAEVILGDGSYLGRRLVEAGYARQVSGDPILRRLEEQARAARRGIWAEHGLQPAPDPNRK